MIAVFLFLAVAASIAAWWLWRNGLAAKPWIEQGVIAGPAVGAAGPAPVAKVGLVVFLAVVASLFALTISAYHMRMHAGDWRPLPDPLLLWVNTGVLIASSVALQSAVGAARRGRLAELRADLAAGGAFAVVFLVGQLAAWRMLVDAGYGATANPANAFFFLVTAVHGVHLLGGLVGLARTMRRAWRAGTAAEARTGTELCALYWHFLLLVWLVLFWMLLTT